MLLSTGMNTYADAAETAAVTFLDSSQNVSETNTTQESENETETATEPSGGEQGFGSPESKSSGADESPDETGNNKTDNENTDTAASSSAEDSLQESTAAPEADVEERVDVSGDQTEETTAPVSAALSAAAEVSADASAETKITAAETAAAAVPAEEKKYAVAAFAVLPEEIGTQQVKYGTRETELTLPHTLDAIVSKNKTAAAPDEVLATISEIADRLAAEESLQEQIAGTEAGGFDYYDKLLRATDSDLADEIQRVKLHVKWTVDESFSQAAEYDPETAGVYTFRAELSSEDYVLAADTDLPAVTVEVLGKGAFFQTAEIDGVRITVTAEEGVFPKGAVLSAAKIESTDEAKVKNAISDKLTEKAEEEDAVPEITDTQSFDIKILDREGNELQPDTEKGEVRVKFTSEKIREAAESEDQNVSIYHFDDRNPATASDLAGETQPESLLEKIGEFIESIRETLGFGDAEKTAEDQDTRSFTEKVDLESATELDTELTDNAESAEVKADHFSTYTIVILGDAAETGEICTYSVIQDARNYGENEEVIYNLSGISKDLFGKYYKATVSYIDNLSEDMTKEVSATDAEGADRTAEFSIPAGIQKFTVSSEDPSLYLQVNREKTGCALLQPADTLQLATDKSICMFSQKEEKNISLHKKWADNGLGSNDKQTVNMTMVLAFKDSDGNWKQLSSENMGALGYTSLIKVSEIESSGNQTIIKNNMAWDYNFTKMLYQYWPSEPHNEIEYRLLEVTKPDAYTATYSETDPATLVNILKVPFEATLQWLDYNNSYDSRPTVEQLKAYIQKFKLTRSVTINGQQSSIEMSLQTTDPAQENYCLIGTMGENQYSIKLPNALGYDENDYPYVYSLVQNAPVNAVIGGSDPAVDGSYYTPEYTNAGNYSLVESALYSGGTLKERLTGKTYYEMTKIWKDDGPNSGRPVTKLTLYRYPYNKSIYSYKQASPVYGENRSQVQARIPIMAAADVGNTVTIYSSTESASAVPSLDAYNENGIKYVYTAKESMVGGTDSYITKYAVPYNMYGISGAAGAEVPDLYIANHATVSNVHTGTTSRTVTKKWIAAARENVQATVEVDLTRKVNNAEEYITSKKLSGFSSEVTSQDCVFSALPKYDKDGKTIEYTVTEGNVTTLGKNAKLQTPYIYTADGYEYEQTITTDASDSTKQIISNQLIGPAVINITKTFNGGLATDSNGNEIYPTITYTVYQNGISVGTIKKTYTAENIRAGSTENVTFSPVAVTSYQDLTGSGKKGTLPRYDENGAEYVYSVEETEIEPEAYGAYGRTINTQQKDVLQNPGRTASYSNLHQLEVNSDVTNYPTGAGGGWVTVSKNWLDDENKEYRKTVHVELRYYNNAAYKVISSGTISPEQQFIYLSLTDSQGESYAEAYQKWNGNTSPETGSYFDVAETELSDSSKTFPVISDTDAKDNKTYAAVHDPNGDEKWNFVATDDQYYDVSMHSAYIKEADNLHTFNFTVTNRRVGVIKIRAVKNWVDGNNAEGKRPEKIVFKRTVDEASSLTETQRTNLNGKFTLGAANAESGDSNKWTYTSANFRKYDDKGKIIWYDVEENNNAGSQTLSSLGYSGNRSSQYIGSEMVCHSGDIYQYTFTNSLSGSVQPKVNKIWKGLKSGLPRPDIYTELYRSVTKGTDTVYEKIGFIDHTWSIQSKTGTADSWWQAQYSSMPLYDSNGYKYTYYIGEGVSTLGTKYQLSGGYATAPSADPADYGDFTEDYSKSKTISYTENNETKNAVVATYTPASGSDAEVAGTLVNKPADTISFTVVKNYANMPASFKPASISYPDVVIHVQGSVDNGLHYNDLYVNNDISGAPVTATVSNIMTVNIENVPRYDINGTAYTDYQLRETSGQPGTDPGIAGKVYHLTQGKEFLGYYRLTNGYIENQEYSVSVSKSWTNLTKADTAHGTPKATFKLVRYMTDAKGMEIDGTAESVGAVKTLPYQNTQGNATATWRHIAYYGPNLYPYIYKVIEVGGGANLNGYTVKDGSGNVLPASDDPVNTKGKGYIQTANDNSGTEHSAASAAFTDEYGAAGKINVQKVWTYNNQYNIHSRPDKILVKLQRKNSGNAQDAWESIKDVELTKDNGYKTEVSGLQIYAPDGNKYNYQITEDQSGVTGLLSAYTQKSAIAVAATPSAAQADGTASITNTEKTETIQVNKSWKSASGAEYGSTWYGYTDHALPKAIIYTVQYRATGSDAPSDSQWNDLLRNGSVYTVRMDPAVDNTNKTVDYSGILQELDSAKYKVPVQFPSYMILTDTSGNEKEAAVEYRASESALVFFDENDAAKEVTLTLAEAISKGRLTKTEESEDNNRLSDKPNITNVANTVPAPGISVRKVWDTGFGRYNDRLLVQIRLYQKAQSEDNWHEYRNSTDPFDYYLKASEGYLHTWVDLPENKVPSGLENGSKDPYSYQAVETAVVYDTDNNGAYDAGTDRISYVDNTAVPGTALKDPFSGTAGGYQYHSAISDALKDAQNTAFATELTNTIATGSIRVRKTWSDNENAYASQPQEITVTLSMSAAGRTIQPSDYNLSTTSVLTAANRAGTDGNVWEDSETWKNVPVADAMGNPITYTLREDTDTAYTSALGITGDGVTAASGNQADPASGSFTLATDSTAAADFTNTIIPTSFTVEKKWGENLLAINDQVKSVQVKLQHATASDASGDLIWSDVLYADGQAVKADLTAASVSAGSWTKTWTDLPKFDTAANASDKELYRYHYRAVETGITMNDGTRAAVSADPLDETRGTVGGYHYSSRTAETGNTSGTGNGLTEPVYKTTLTNTLATASVVVLKEWAGYLSGKGEEALQPDSIRVTLHASSAAGTDIFRYNGTLINNNYIVDETRTLRASEHWMATWSELPVMDAAGNRISYTITEDDGGNTALYYTAANVVTEAGTATDSNAGAAVTRTITEGAETDIRFTNTLAHYDLGLTKLDEDDGTLAVSGAVYGLYRKELQSANANIFQRLAGWIGSLITGYEEVDEQTTDANGKVTFADLIPGVEYKIRELAVPDGYQISAEDATVTGTLAANGMTAVSVTGADGTVTVTDHGTLAAGRSEAAVSWLEPPVRARILKENSSGTVLAGAELKVTDPDGNTVAQWTTTDSTDGYLITSGKLKAGVTYTLTELKAPAGYRIAEPVDFVIPARKTGSKDGDKNACTAVVMTDARTSGGGGGGNSGTSPHGVTTPAAETTTVAATTTAPAATGPSGSNPGGSVGPTNPDGTPLGAFRDRNHNGIPDDQEVQGAGRSRGAKTGDASHTLLYFLIFLASLGGEIAVFVSRRKKKQK